MACLQPLRTTLRDVLVLFGCLCSLKNPYLLRTRFVVAFRTQDCFHILGHQFAGLVRCMRDWKWNRNWKWNSARPSELRRSGQADGRSGRVDRTGQVRSGDGAGASEQEHEGRIESRQGTRARPGALHCFSRQT